MADRLTPEARSRVMSRIRGKNTTPERYVFSLAQAAGLQFVRHADDLPGCPDLVLERERVAVFIDGDFWHGFRFPQWAECLPTFWREKIAGNRARDSRNRRKLRRLRWRALRIWEHEVEQDAVACIARIAQVAGVGFCNLDAARTTLAELPPLKRRRRLPKSHRRVVGGRNVKRT